MRHIVNLLTLEKVIYESNIDATVQYSALIFGSWTGCCQEETEEEKTACTIQVDQPDP